MAFGQFTFWTVTLILFWQENLVSYFPIWLWHHSPSLNMCAILDSLNALPLFLTVVLMFWSLVHLHSIIAATILPYQLPTHIISYMSLVVAMTVMKHSISFAAIRLYICKNCMPTFFSQSRIIGRRPAVDCCNFILWHERTSLVMLALASCVSIYASGIFCRNNMKHCQVLFYFLPFLLNSLDLLKFWEMQYYLRSFNILHLQHNINLNFVITSNKFSYCYNCFKDGY